ncbi:uncharacterized protein LOC128554789 [Mercenaria mercenaria]|uniref:uncharacterized protein LOC128554789 n=1 Tax=Mercenaria mercenaria TaxID=6596 RepID=UPI00234F2157|nr:uncharacterized protein LOC128554789 [Mercenaria mercenaria]
MSKQAGASKYRQYSPSKVATAVSMVESGAMTKRKVAITYGIPRTNFHVTGTWWGGKAPLGAKPGKPCVLTEAEEVVLVDYVKLMSSIGYPLKRQELCYEVKKVLDHDGRKTPFKDNLPGKRWYQLFTKRHTDLSERSAMALGHQRSHINFEMIDGWFNGLKSFLKQEVPDWESLLQDPRRIFNADKSGSPLSVTSGKVLTEKGVRHVYQVCTSNKTQITVLVCFNAIGNYVPPLIVYPGESFRDSGIHEFDEAIYGHTSSGWMDSELFVSFLKHFNDFVVDISIPKPVMFLVDGHSTHMSLAAAHFCFTNDIILYCLLENATHVLQLCDVGFFSPMKAAWKKEVNNWQLENLGQALTKKQFPGVFKNAWLKVAKLENAVHGFQKCGLFPLNPRNIDLTKLNPSKAITRVTGSGDNPSAHQGVTSTQPTETCVEDKSTDVDQLDKSTVEVSTCNQITTAVEDKTPNELSTSSVINTVSGDQLIADQGTSRQTTTASGDSSRREIQSMSCVTQTREQTISKSFSLLHVPEIKKKRSANTVRNKLPKALSGKEALKILLEKEDAKRAEEFAKQKRKEDRLAKKAQKLEEKEQKRIQREETKRKKKQAQLEKLAAVQSKKRKTTESSSSESDVREDAPNLIDSDDEYNEELTCPGCMSDEGSQEEWIQCKACQPRWHITCTGDAVLFEIPAEHIQNYPFHCEFCV